MAQSGRPKKVDPRINDLRTYIGNGEFATAKKLLSEFGINVQDGDGRTGLINSVIEQKTDFLKWLMENGADINVQDRGGYCALHFVGQNRLVEIGKQLLEKNADLQLRDKYGNTPLWTALMNAREDVSVVKLFIAKGANLDSKNNAGRTPREMIKTIASEAFTRLIDELKL